MNVVNRLPRMRRLAIILLVLLMGWLFSGKILMEMAWTELDFDSTNVEDLQRDLAEGRTGPQLKPFPCMTNQTTIDLDLRLDGPFPIGIGRSVVMEVFVLSNPLMVDRLYLGPPVRQLTLQGLPICLEGRNLPDNVTSDEAFGQVIVHFTDLEGRTYISFSGEDAFPILAWRSMRIDWSVVAWVMEGTESLSKIMVTPL